MSHKYTFCPICSSRRIAVELHKFDMTMLRCRECGAVFTSPQPPTVQVLSRYVEQWFEREYLPSYNIDPQNPSLEHLAPRFAPEFALIERFRQNGRVLDVGAGAGLFLFHAREHGWQPHGVEISGYGPAYAKRHFDLDIIQGDLLHAQFPDQHFDVVMLQDTIEHVPDPLALVREIHRILRNGGAIVLSTPNYQSLSRRVFRQHWALISPAEHLFLFTMRSILQLFQRSGFAPFRLESSPELHESLFHSTKALFPLRLRSALLRHLKHIVPPLTVRRLSLGTELHAVGVKKPVPDTFGSIMHFNETK